MPTRADLAKEMAKASPVQQVDAAGPSAAPPKLYDIWSRSQGKKVAEASSLKSATSTINRRDNVYGGYDHYFKKKGD